ncbi:hypothetical protein ZWY2020_008952 [Hordeum vulgare]|nr:hypothetical protein ZWY2020_008952 [Hordeum vulgare]
MVRSPFTSAGQRTRTHRRCLGPLGDDADGVGAAHGDGGDPLQLHGLRAYSAADRPGRSARSQSKGGGGAEAELEFGGARSVRSVLTDLEDAAPEDGDAAVVARGLAAVPRRLLLLSPALADIAAFGSGKARALLREGVG